MQRLESVKCKLGSNSIEAFKRDALYDTVPVNNELRDHLKNAPTSLMCEVGCEYSQMGSVAYGAISRSSFHLADFILKQENGRFVSNIDPFFYGQSPVRFTLLAQSAGLNVYLALLVLEYYSEKNKLSELIDKDNLEVIKTYCDCLYWEGFDGQSHYEVVWPEKSDNGSIVDFTKSTAIWFMRFAYKIFELEQELKVQLQPKSFLSQMYCSFSSSVVVRKTSVQLYEELGDHYLHIAHMEANNEKAFYYFLKKALHCYRQSLTNTDSIKEFLVFEIGINQADFTARTPAYNYFLEQRNELKKRGVATSNYSLDADQVWRDAFELAGDKIRSQGIASCVKLWDSDVDSGRTSSEERHSRDSDAQEGKHADVSASLTDKRDGLYHRSNFAQNQMISNPMSAKT